LTEDQARAKSCPFARNRASTKQTDGLCLASDCMAWRWEAAAVREENNKIFPFGYCGLAGEEK